MDTIYFFAVDARHKNILKVGRSNGILAQIKNYNVGIIKEIELKYIALVKNPLLIEKCIKILLKKIKYFLKKNYLKLILKY